MGNEKSPTILKDCQDTDQFSNPVLRPLKKDVLQHNDVGGNKKEMTTSPSSKTYQI